MSAQICLRTKQEGEEYALHSTLIAAQIDELMQARLHAYAEHPEAARSTETERSVDELLDTLSKMHRLEQLAAYAARGGKINVEADRVFIAQNEAAYRQLLERYAAQQPAHALIMSTLLPFHPKPIE